MLWINCIVVWKTLDLTIFMEDLVTLSIIWLIILHYVSYLVIFLEDDDLDIEFCKHHMLQTKS